MNFCAYSQENDVLASWTTSRPSFVLGCNPIASVDMPVGVSVPPLCLCPSHHAWKVLELTSTSRTLTPPVIIAALTSLSEEGCKVLLSEILLAVRRSLYAVEVVCSLSLMELAQP